MDSFLNLLRLALDRGWALGALLAIFFGAVVVAPTFGLPIPLLLEEWSAAGMLFGLSVLIVSLLSHGLQAIGKWIQKRGSRRNEKIAKDEDAREAFANLSALNRDELKIFHDLLLNAPPRFEVHILNAAHGLIEKGILVPVRGVGGMSWICEIHLAILEHRGAIVVRLNEVFSAA